MSYVVREAPEWRSSQRVVEAIRESLGWAGYQCGDCVKFYSCQKIAQEEFCLEWEFSTPPGKPSGSQR